MNSYRFAEISVGMRAAFVASVDPDSIDLFQRITGDMNPLHADDEFAHASGFKSRLVHGMHIAGFYSKLVGHYLPGRYALLHRVDVSFISPAFEGDKLTVIGEVIAVNVTAAQIEIKAEIVGDSGRVSRAKIWAGVLE